MPDTPHPVIAFFYTSRGVLGSGRKTTAPHGEPQRVRLVDSVLISDKRLMHELIPIVH